MGLAMKMTEAYFDSIGFGYREVRDDAILTGTGGLKNKGNIEIVIIFDENDRTVGLRSHDYCTFAPEKKAAMYEMCSKANDIFRWVKFFVDEEDNTITLADDAVIQPDSCGEELVELVVRMCSIADEAYPMFMKAIWA